MAKFSQDSRHRRLSSTSLLSVDFDDDSQPFLFPAGMQNFALCESQNLAMELYESRVASLQRFVAMTVLFHEMGSRVQQFFPAVSFGYLGYRMDRTQSILRIATTASPISGADVRERMEAIQHTKTIHGSVGVIERAWYRSRHGHNGQR